MKDIYAEEIEWLTNHPHHIRSHWKNGLPLFAFARNEDVPEQRKNYAIGCLTMIAAGVDQCAATPELTAKIKSDPRIPKSLEAITLQDLPVFAEYQREIDVVLNRTPEKIDFSEFHQHRNDN